MQQTHPDQPTIKQLRMQLRMTQKDVAELAGYHEQVIGRAERGLIITWKTADAICKAVGTTPEKVSGLNISQRLYSRRVKAS